MTSQEIQRLKGDLGIVEKNIKVFSDIITETPVPGTENAQDAALLPKLDKSCHEMQDRLSQLLSNLDPDAHCEIFMDALRVNDELNNIFLRYERFCRSRPQTNAASTPSHPAEPSGPAEGVLIDFGDSGSTPVSNAPLPIPPGGRLPPIQPGNSEFWLNQDQAPQSTGPSEFDEFLATRLNSNK